MRTDGEVIQDDRTNIDHNHWIVVKHNVSYTGYTDPCTLPKIYVPLVTKPVNILASFKVALVKGF